MYPKRTHKYDQKTPSLKDIAAQTPSRIPMRRLPYEGYIGVEAGASISPNTTLSSVLSQNLIQRFDKSQPKRNYDIKSIEALKARTPPYIKPEERYKVVFMVDDKARVSPWYNLDWVLGRTFSKADIYVTDQGELPGLPVLFKAPVIPEKRNYRDAIQNAMKADKLIVYDINIRLIYDYVVKMRFPVNIDEDGKILSTGEDLFDAINNFINSEIQNDDIEELVRTFNKSALWYIYHLRLLQFQEGPNYSNGDVKYNTLASVRFGYLQFESFKFIHDTSKSGAAASSSATSLRKIMTDFSERHNLVSEFPEEQIVDFAQPNMTLSMEDIAIGYNRNILTTTPDNDPDDYDANNVSINSNLPGRLQTEAENTVTQDTLKPIRRLGHFSYILQNSRSKFLTGILVDSSTITKVEPKSLTFSSKVVLNLHPDTTTNFYDSRYAARSPTVLSLQDRADQILGSKFVGVHYEGAYIVFLKPKNDSVILMRFNGQVQVGNEVF